MDKKNSFYLSGIKPQIIQPTAWSLNCVLPWFPLWSASVAGNGSNWLGKVNAPTVTWWWLWLDMTRNLEYTGWTQFPCPWLLTSSALYLWLLVCAGKTVLCYWGNSRGVGTYRVSRLCFHCTNVFCVHFILDDGFGGAEKCVGGLRMWYLIGCRQPCVQQ